MSQQDTTDMSKYFYRASAADFMKIPGSPIVYWASPSVRNIFEEYSRLSTRIETREGLTSGNNDLFLRLWHEVAIKSIGFNLRSNAEATKSEKRYFPYIKGGEFRRWSGNFEYVVNWFRDGEELRVFSDPSTGRIRSHNYNGDYAFRKGLTWSGISSGSFAVRSVPHGFMFDAKGPMGFSTTSDETSVEEAFLNSAVTNHFLKMLAPTLDFKLGHILNLPFANGIQRRIIELRNSAVDISDSDWDSFEYSWNFKCSPLIPAGESHDKLDHAYEICMNHWKDNVSKLKTIETEINDTFITMYGLQDELSPHASLHEVSLIVNPYYRYGVDKSDAELETMLQCDTMEELVSYAIGCMMGRYSLDKPGLILASQGETLQDYLSQIPSPRFAPDNDGILPLTDQEWFADDATNRFREFVRVVWGDEHLQENLDFVAESLCLHAIKPKRGESALDSIRRYLSTQFYKDHLKTVSAPPTPSCNARPT